MNVYLISTDSTLRDLMRPLFEEPVYSFAWLSSDPGEDADPAGFYFWDLDSVPLKSQTGVIPSVYIFSGQERLSNVRSAHRAILLRRPFSLRECARLVRDPERSDKGDKTRQGQDESRLTLLENRLVYRSAAVALTPAEFRLLSVLLHSDGAYVPAADLERKEGKDGSNPVRVHLSHLRRKIRDLCGLDLIRTVKGKGYRIEKGFFGLKTEGAE